MSEELELSIGIDGYSKFLKQMGFMDSAIKETADAWEESGSAADDAAQGYDNASDAAENVADSNKRTRLSLTDLKSGIDLVIGGIKTFAKITQQAFEMGEQGAQVRQAAQAIETLGLNMDELRTAAGGTISDMSLISSTAKLLAGTTGDLNARMRETAPQLLEIARAAVKLDPTIGDVAFVYQSLAAGIKKNQPLLIDNANIIVKVGAAQKQFAEKIGKTVTQLSAQEKAMALLEATLEGGATLIEQVGGSVDSATDSYSRFTAQTKNITDALKAEFSEGLEPLVGAWGRHYEALNAQEGPLFTVGNLLQNVQLFLTGTSKATMEYAATQAEAALQTEISQKSIALYTEFAEQATTQTLDLGDNVVNSAEAFDQYTQAIEGSDQATQDYTQAQLDANEAAIAAETAFNNAAASLGELSKASFVKAQIDELAKALDRGDISAREFADAQEALLIKSGLLTEAERKTQEQVDKLKQAFIDGKISAEEFSAGVLLLKDSIDKIQDKTVTITVDYNIPSLPSGPGPQIAQHYQSGGTLSGGGFIAGEFGPEMISGVNSGNVLSSPATRRILARGGDTTNNNFNLTTNSTTRPGGLALEFESMGMAVQ